MLCPNRCRPAQRGQKQLRIHFEPRCKAGEAPSSAAAPCREHPPVPALPPDAAVREYPAVCPSASFPQRQPATAFGSGWGFFKFPQWHRGSRIVAGLLLLISCCCSSRTVLLPSCSAQPCSPVPSTAWIQLPLPSRHMVPLLIPTLVAQRPFPWKLSGKCSLHPSPPGTALCLGTQRVSLAGVN